MRMPSDMKVAFHNYPARRTASAYEAAVAQYAAAVCERAGAIYQAGNVRYPGLSDIDLVVVVRRAAWDNNQFFSPYVRLPQDQRALFHHEPRFIPEPCIDALPYSSCVHSGSDAAQAPASFGSRRRLVFGSDILGAIAVDVRSPDWQRCRVLEVAFTMHRVLAELQTASSVDVVKLMSRATSLRYPMRHLHDLLGCSWDASYERRVDAARSTLLDEARSAAERRAVAEDAYALFLTAAQRYQANVRTLFELPAREPLHVMATQMLSGGRPAPGVDPEYIAARLAAVSSYQAAQRAYRISTGSIFASKPLRGDYHRYAQPLVHRLASSARWRLSFAR